MTKNPIDFDYIQMKVTEANLITEIDQTMHKERDEHNIKNKIKKMFSVSK